MSEGLMHRHGSKQPHAQQKGNGDKMHRLLISIKKEKYLLLMLLPVMVYYVLFYFKPFGGLVMAFQDYKPFLGVAKSPWVGLENFKTFFQGAYFGRIMKNTLVLSGLSLIFSFPVPIILAILFNEIKSKRFRTTIQTISYLPRFISIVVVAGLLINFLSPSTGIINMIIKAFGGKSIYFLSKPGMFRTIFILQAIWSGAGFGSIVYYSSLCSINSELYEAVKIDGGGRFSQIWHVSLPGLRSTIAIMLIMKIGSILNISYELIILIYQPVTYNVADVVNTYVYRMGFENGNYGLATAVGLFNGVASLVLVSLANFFSKKIGDVSIY